MMPIPKPNQSGNPPAPPYWASPHSPSTMPIPSICTGFNPSDPTLPPPPWWSARCNARPAYLHDVCSIAFSNPHSFSPRYTNQLSLDISYPVSNYFLTGKYKIFIDYGLFIELVYEPLKMCTIIWTRKRGPTDLFKFLFIYLFLSLIISYGRTYVGHQISGPGL